MTTPIGNSSQPPKFNPFIEKPSIIQLPQKIWTVDGLPIFGFTREQCEKGFELYKSLGEPSVLGKRSELGVLIRDTMTNSMRQEGLAIVTVPGTTIPKHPEWGGLFDPTPAEMLGKNYKTRIILPIDDCWIRSRLKLNHEATHFFVSRLTPDNSCCPLSGLSMDAKFRFTMAYNQLAEKLKCNPHPVNSIAWNKYNYIYKSIFDIPLLGYKGQSLFTETVAWACQFELSFPGTLRQFSPELTDELHHLLFSPRTLPAGGQVPFQPQPPSFMKVSLAELNEGQNLSPFKSILKSMGQGVRKLAENPKVQTGTNYGIGCGLDVLFYYLKDEENALLKGLINGAITLKLGIANFCMYSKVVGPKIAIGLSIGKMVSAMTPDFNAMADTLPSNEQIASLCGNNKLLHGIMLEQNVQSRVTLKMMGALQKALNALPDLVQMWNEKGRGKVDAKIDQLLPDNEWRYNRLQKEFLEIEAGLKRIEDFIADHVSKYLDDIPGAVIDRSQQLSDVQFRPDLNALTPALPTQGVVDVKQDTLDKCQLNWAAQNDSMTGVTTVNTSLEVPKEELKELEAIATEELEASPPEVDPISVGGQGTQSTQRKPNFGELSKITDVRIGAGIGGGIGVIATLASGAEISLSATGSAILTGVSVPLTKGFLMALGTGLVYAAPVAALLVGVQLLIKSHEKKVLKHLKKDSKAAQKESITLQGSIKEFNQFLEQFQKGEIDKQTFLKKVNSFADQFQEAAHKMGHRGRYADHHKQGKKSAFQYFEGQTKYRQIDADLHTIANEAIVKKEVEDQYAPKLKSAPFKTLVDDLQKLSQKRILTIQEKYQQEALLQEISGRWKNENAEGLNALDALADKPVAISFNPQGVAKPSHIRSDHFKADSEDSAKRRRDRTQDWADGVNKKYVHFCRIAQSGDYDEILKAGKELQNLLKEGKERLFDYKLTGVKGHGSIGSYYKGFESGISGNVQSTLDKAKAAKDGTVTEDTRIYFTADELKSMKIAVASDEFNQGLTALKDPSKNESEHDAGFGQMFHAVQVFESLGYRGSSDEEAKVIESTSNIGKEYGTYTAYQKAINRLKEIQADLKSIQEATDKMNDASIKKDEYAKQYKLAYDKALKLLESGFKEEDLLKLLEKPEDAKQIAGWVESIRENYPVFVKVGEYDNHTLHAVSTPAVRILLHALNDFNRYEGYGLLKIGVQALSTAHSLVPGTLPAAANYLIALHKNECPAVMDALYSRVASAVKGNPVFCHPKTALAKAATLNKKAALAQGASVVVQLGAAAITACTSKVFGEEKAARFNTAVYAVSNAVGFSSSALYYANLMYKTKKYIDAGSLALKVHKIGQGLASIGLAGFDIFEFLATDADEMSAGLKKALKDYLPQFHGNLPESWTYYMGKDLLVTAGIGAFAVHPVMMGLAAYQGAAWSYNLYAGKYTDDVLSAIMINCRHFLKQLPSESRNHALKKSCVNLKYYLNGVYKIDPSESRIQQRAKMFYFETLLDQLDEEKKWEEILEKTAIAKGKFTGLNIEVSKAPGVYFKRFMASTKKMIEGNNFIPIFKSLRELDSVLESFPKAQKTKECMDAFKSLRVNLLTNFCVYNLQHEMAWNPFVSIKLFDEIPKESRDLPHWHMVGCALEQLKSLTEGVANYKLTILERFAFQRIKDLLDESRLSTPYHQSMRICSDHVLDALSQSLGEDPAQLIISKDTDSVLQVIEKILAGDPPAMPFVKIKPQGFANIGNTCFMNAALQLVLHNPELIGSLEGNDPLVKELKSLASQEAISPIDLLKFQGVAVASELIQMDREEDAQELLGHILGRVEKGAMLHLHLEDGNNTLEALFQKAFKPATLISNSEFLYLHLVRFKTVTENGQVKTKKIEEPVLLPENGKIDLTSYFVPEEDRRLYEIVGRINHTGSLDFGHYTADILKETDWYHCNDERVTKGQRFKWKDNEDKSAYVVALRRI